MINQEILSTIQQKLKENFAELEKELGVTIILDGGTYTDEEGKLKIKVLPNKEDMNKIKEDYFKRVCSYFGLKPEDYNKTFVDKGVTYRLIGIAKNKRKYPMIIKDIKTGNEYSCTIDYIKNHILNEED